MRAVDTNVLVRLLVRDNARQLTRAEAFISTGAWVSHLVLAECVWVLSAVYALEKARIAAAVSMLLSHQQLVIERTEIVQAALAAYLARGRVGFTDCLVVEIAKSAGHVPLGTFDRALAGAAGAIEIT
jgi:predicted nucleic-acid-binding protein